MPARSRWCNPPEIPCWIAASCARSEPVHCRGHRRDTPSTVSRFIFRFWYLLRLVVRDPMARCPACDSDYRIGRGATPGLSVHRTNHRSPPTAHALICPRNPHPKRIRVYPAGAARLQEDPDFQPISPTLRRQPSNRSQLLSISKSSPTEKRTSPGVSPVASRSLSGISEDVLAPGGLKSVR